VRGKSESTDGNLEEEPIQEILFKAGDKQGLGMKVAPIPWKHKQCRHGFVWSARRKDCVRKWRG